MSDLDLAWAVEADDPEAWQEVRRRFTPVAMLLARRICSRIGHRGRRCPGLGCDLAFTWVALDLLDKFAGHDTGGGRRRASPLIVTWRWGAPGGGGFAAYVLGPAGQGQRGMVTEGRRAWNRARGLRVRANPSRDMARRGEDLYRQLTGGGELAAAARRLGLRRPGAIWRWSEALFVDDRLPDGTWHCQSQLPTGRPEATAWVLLALCERYDWARAREARSPFERLLQPEHDRALWSHVLSLTLAVPTLSTLSPDSALLERLVWALEDAAVRDRQGRILYWTQRARPAEDPEAVPSPAHTARAMLALQHCWRATDRRVGTAPQDLETAARWLLDQPWDNLYEEIRRPIGVDRFEVLATRHCTSAWVARALLQFGVDPRDQRIRSAIGELYTSHQDGLWDWDLPGHRRIPRPVWATLDALRALEPTSSGRAGSRAGPPAAPAARPAWPP